MKIMWAWYDKTKNEYWHIYRSKFLVEMCSPDGFRSAIERGEGEIVEVEICHHTTQSTKGE